MTAVSSRKRMALAFVPVIALILAGCGTDPGTPGSTPDPRQNNASIADVIADIKLDKTLQAELPKSVRDSGVLSVASFNGQPPWVIPGDDPDKFTGVTADIADAFQKLLGIKLERHALGGLPEIKTGIQAKRYDFALGPVGDSLAVQQTIDMLDWVQEHVVFAVPKGNPLKLNTLADTCGHRMAVIAGGTAETVLEDQNKKCTAAGKKAAEILTFAQQPAAILAVQSDRADGYFSSQALLTYYVQQKGSGLELAATGQDNGFPDFFQGAAFPKGSPLEKVMLAAFKKLSDLGVYQEILTQWDLKDSILKDMGMNLRTF